MTRFKTIGLLLAVPPALPLPAAESVWDRGAPALYKPVEITVYRSPTCTCCGKWLEHMKRHGFAVEDIQTEAMAGIKKRHGVPDKLQSCHTAVIGTRVVEGHVPAADVRAFLEQGSDKTGLSVPGMPSGTPGMEMGGPKDPFAVLEFDRQGHPRVFHDYRSY
jgi:hypothetical protein